MAAANPRDYGVQPAGQEFSPGPLPAGHRGAGHAGQTDKKPLF